MNNLTEHTILEEAIRRFMAITGATARKLQATGENMDAILQLTMGKDKHQFFLEVKNELREPAIQRVIEQFGREKERWLLVCRYIPQPLKQQLKGLGVNYLETAGNCFIRAGALFLYINDQQVTPARQLLTGKLWKEAGLKFLFAVLTDPLLINGRYRAIADKATIALGNIGQLLEELKEGGYVKQTGTVLMLTKRDQLIQRWAELFHLTLRPKLVRGTFSFLNPTAEKAWPLVQPKHFFWGGEPAANRLTGYLRPEKFTVYALGAAADIMRELKAVPDPAGNIEWLQLFWKDAPAIKGCVPPLLIYADLIATADSRLYETAQRIKTKYLVTAPTLVGTSS